MGTVSAPVDLKELQNEPGKYIFAPDVEEAVRQAFVAGRTFNDGEHRVCKCEACRERDQKAEAEAERYLARLRDEKS
jgi:hypothetical protein